MIKLLGLFSNQKEAQSAANALSEAHLGQAGIRLMNRWLDEFEQPL